jgi:hypothetical protein
MCRMYPNGSTQGNRGHSEGMVFHKYLEKFGHSVSIILKPILVDV